MENKKSGRAELLRLIKVANEGRAAERTLQDEYTAQYYEAASGDLYPAPSRTIGPWEVVVDFNAQKVRVGCQTFDIGELRYALEAIRDHGGIVIMSRDRKLAATRHHVRFTHGGASHQITWDEIQALHTLVKENS